MSVFIPGDDPYHYQDNSHRWIAPATCSQAAWDAGLRAHLEMHRKVFLTGADMKPAVRSVVRPRRSPEDDRGQAA